MNFGINDIVKLPKILGINGFKSVILFLSLGFVSNFLIVKIRDSIINRCGEFCNYGRYDFFPLSLDLIKIIAWVMLYIMLRQFINWFQPYGHSAIRKIGEKKKKDWYVYPKTAFSKNRKSFYQEWNIQGYPILSKQGLVFTNSEAGCLIKPKIFLKFWNIRLNLFWCGRVWKNFDANFTTKFKKQIRKTLNPQETIGGDYKKHKLPSKEFQYLIGVIFRAQSFDDYFMLEIWKKGIYLCIRPHVRVFGNWDAPFLNPDDNSLKLRNDNSKDIDFSLIVKDEVVTLIVDGDKNKPLTWMLPSKYKVNLSDDRNNQEEARKGIVNSIPFKNMSGMFGFRNYGNEIAIIKNLKVEPLE